MRMSLITALPPSKKRANFAVVQGCVLSARVNITKLFSLRGLTKRALGVIICPMKSEKNSAGVGTLFARQISCQLRGLATPDSAIFLVIFTIILVIFHYTLRFTCNTIALLIRWANQLNKDDNMSKYTPTMIEKMSAAQPLNLAKAQSFASEFGVSHRSIIAKALSLGLTYEKKAVSSSSSDRPTKADLVREIEQSLQGESLDGLQGASMRSLQALLMSIG